MNNIEKKRKEEIEVVTLMIEIYCKKNHGTKTLCENCEKLKEYSITRSNKCPHIENKTFCSSCKTHCYSPEMREQIKNVMKFSGPRMILYHPIVSIKHIIDTLKNKKSTN